MLACSDTQASVTGSSMPGRSLQLLSLQWAGAYERLSRVAFFCMMACACVRDNGMER